MIGDTREGHEVIILAGGLGTRLRGAIDALLPKCMAPINGKPFLYYLFLYLEQQQVQQVILSLGHHHEAILDWANPEDWPFKIQFVIEKESLGTGGGIQLALQSAKNEATIVLNGDTLFTVDLDSFMRFHLMNEADTSLALKPMKQIDRYGIIDIAENGCIRSFKEKTLQASGLINGGVYILKRNKFLQLGLPERFSFEKNYLESYVSDGNMYGFISNAYFIDIGIPEDYNKAIADFKNIFTV